MPDAGAALVGGHHHAVDGLGRELEERAVVERRRAVHIGRGHDRGGVGVHGPVDGPRPRHRGTPGPIRVGRSALAGEEPAVGVGQRRVRETDEGPRAVGVVFALEESRRGQVQVEEARVRREQLLGGGVRPVAPHAIAEEAAVDGVPQAPGGHRVEGAGDDAGQVGVAGLAAQQETGGEGVGLDPLGTAAEAG